MSDAADPQGISQSANKARTGSFLKRAATPVAAGYWLTLYVGTHIPNPEMLIGPHTSDKLLHFSAYFILYAVLALRIRILHEAWPTRRQTIILAAVTSLFSAFDEITQGIPIINRYPDLMDAVADCSGVVAAMLVISLVDWAESRIRTDSRDRHHTDS